MKSRTKYKYVAMVRDRHSGQPRYFFRPRGHKAVRLPGAYGSHDFALEHARLLQAYEGDQRVVKQFGSPDAPAVKPAERVTFLPGSIATFVKEYQASDEFKALAPMSQYNYRKALDFLVSRRGAARLDDLTVDEIDAYTRTIKSRSAADLQVRMISLLWQFAIGSPHFKRKGRSNPTTDAKKRYGVGHPHDEWAPEVASKFLAVAKPHARLLYWLLRETGQRLGDVANMKWAHYDGETILIARTEKTKNPVFVAVSDQLREVLDGTPRDCEWILSKASKQLKKGTLSHLIGRTLNKIGYGRRGSAEEVYSAHGLRKSFASEWAMSTGGNVPAMQAALGHASPKMSLYYAHQAKKKLLALEGVKAVNAARRRAAAVDQDDVIDMTAVRRKAG